ncbi:mediator of RNA polymerase II transcription subunit 20a-like isoform X1 [Mercurialis annua]|uniref:mediator of RNA polymerase II transcription subunit 20a-like isoform X1 n=1 Tax=Mercurialis annua TaxID=3986 RepID=UPI0024AD8754|nr:mediator of RNA polymerase II transcription subunit 20a-like isoform X1 [Mercurialis annua]
MPLKWVLHWQPNAGATVNTQILNEVSQCAETINGVKEGRWKAALTSYKPVLRDQSLAQECFEVVDHSYLYYLNFRKEIGVLNFNFDIIDQSLAQEFPRDFLGISLPDQPNKYYFMIRGQRLLVEADSSIQTIMEKLQSYKSRVALLLEGFQYQLGDFQLRIGKVVHSHSENLRGIVMEVEYMPISSIEKARPIMEDFTEIWQETISNRSLPGHFVHIEPNFSDYGLLDQYSSQHTALQYATVVAQLIATQTVQAGRN